MRHHLAARACCAVRNASLALSLPLLACSSRPAAHVQSAAAILPASVPDRDDLASLIDSFVVAHSRCSFNLLAHRVAESARFPCLGPIQLTWASLDRSVIPEAVVFYVQARSDSNEYAIHAIPGAAGWSVVSLALVDY